jgi:tetratricopeptide (TPR) repeat protein
MVPSKAWKAFQKATERFQKSDLAGARLQLDKAIELWPRFAAALTLRGVLKTHSALPHDAVEDFNAALDADRTYGLAYIGLAENHNATGNFDEAMNVLDRGSAYLTQMWQLHYEVSKALFGKKSFSRALQEASRASTMLGHELPGLCFIKAEAYVNLGDARAARTELETYLKENGNRPGADRLHQLLASLNTR